MPKYRFNPPLTLKGGGVVRTLDDAIAFVRSYRDPHLPKSSAAVLLSIEEARPVSAMRQVMIAILGVIAGIRSRSL